MSVYVGIDVHRKRSQVAVITEDGAVVLDKTVANGSEPMLRLIGDLPSGTPVAFEAAFGWGWLVQLLEDCGFGPHLVHLRNRIHAAAADHGYDRGASYCTGPGRGWLAEPGPARRIAGRSSPAAWRSPAALTLAIERLDGELHQYAKADPRVRALRTLPGAGEFTALVMVAEIGDISRFGGARKPAARAGQTPTVQGSDLKVRHGHISKQGPAWLRWAINQAAQAGMPPLMAANCGNFWRPTVKL